MARGWRLSLTPKSLEITRSLLLLTTRQRCCWGVKLLTSVTSVGEIRGPHLR